ncbi:MAG TPA: Nramp family divalent metal transporter [Rhizomicrobium sp.]|jgi:NRAMP (natural resistance-associated macrophage protein)-like metal ion transporter|nr:Nramp family divalent metal transporter [Rhizomicrobium sp.]
MSDTGADVQVTESQPAAKPNGIHKYLAILGPGLVTGAADDDPSGIATYSQVGAQFGYQMGWTMVLAYPLMTAIQEIAARIGSTTGHGIAANLRRHYPRWVLDAVVIALLIANTINLGADIAAMGDAAALLLPGPMQLWAVVITVLSFSLEAWLSYARYASILKWTTLSLFAYVAAVIVAHVDWGAALGGLVIPRLGGDGAAATALVAVLGTTISPYLFFWQSSQEVEELQRRHRKALFTAPRSAGEELKRIRLDTLTGMAVSNIIAIFIIFAVAATLHTHGIHNINSSVQAAQALAPIAGRFASTIFAVGIIGTGLLALPVLAGSAGYAVCESFRWTASLDCKPKAARAFYGVIAGATGIGLALAFSPIDPMKALYWSAVVNGVLAAPLMVVMMLISSNTRIMGRLVIGWKLKAIGWLATAVMGAATVGLFVT